MNWIKLADRLPPVGKDDGQPNWNTVLAYFPRRHADPEFPGHSIDVSSRDWIRKHGRKYGVTYWAEVENPPEP